jgi:hypothetical protein
VGGNLIDYPGELTTQTADLVTSKILWNSIISTPNAKYTCADIGDMYLQTPMDRYEYMRIKANLVPDEFKDLYKLHDKIHNGFIYMEIRRGCYGLPQAGILANKLLKKRLAKHGYFELPHTPGLFKHISRPSRAAGIFFLGSVPRDKQPINLNGAIHVLCTILKFVAASASEAELGALFLNAKEAKVMRLTLEELGHPQPPILPSTLTTQQQWE